MTEKSEQFSMRFADADERIGSDFMLGIVTDHRRFFAALEDGWMRPLPSRTGVSMGIGTYLNEVSEHSSKHPILIRSKIRPTKLPDICIHVLRNGRWVESRTSDIQLQDTAIHWPGPLPIFAITELCVQTDEQRARLGGLARSVSNLDLSSFRLNVDPHPGTWSELTIDPPRNAPEFSIPDDSDAIHGALSMAIWGVPRTPPWMDLLVSSLSCDSERLARCAAEVNAPWLQHPAWIQVSDGQRSDTQACFWRAAILVLRTQSPLPTLTPNELAEQIALRALQFTSKESTSAVSKWKASTIRILRGDTSISLDYWRESPVEVAIQLLLTRTDPVMFREWFKDLPDLPPAVAWTATVLCGLLRGYRRLDTQFRGALVQREVLSLHAVRLSDSANSIHTLTAMCSDPLAWHKDLDQFVLSIGGREFARKPENTRSKWYTIDFEDSKARDEAKKFAMERRWPCIRREVQLPSGHIGMHGPGQIALGQASQAIQVSGILYMELPSNAPIIDFLDVGQFLRMISVEPGPIPEPPMSKNRSFRVQHGLVPGLTYVRDFISSDEEQRLIQTIDQCVWDTDSLQRSVQHYGWKYDYKERRVDINKRLGPLPDWAEALALRLFSSNLIEQLPNQVIVNEYRKNQGISKHIDKPDIFAEGIAMLSLNESWEMVFRPPHSREKVAQLLDRRSVAIMKGDARYKWTHEIPKRLNEPGRIRRVRRVSLTFRSVLAPK